MLYGVEINEPYQLNVEFKVRCMLQVSDDYEMSWTNKDERQFCTTNEQSAQEVADTLAESWGAQVIPVEGGTERGADVIEDVIAAFRQRAKERARQTRHIR